MIQTTWECRKGKDSMGFPHGPVGKNSTSQYRRHKRHGFTPRVGKIPRSRKWQPTPLFLPGKFHGNMNLAGYSPWGLKVSDMTEQLSTRTHTHTHTHTHIHRGRIKISSCQGLQRGKDKLAEYIGFSGEWNYSIWYYNDGWMDATMHLSTLNAHQEWVNPKVNYGLWVMTLCPLLVDQ